MSKSKLQAIVQKKCPQCREGDLFKNSALSLKFNQINHRCTECNANLEPETGFYYGAMYVSYGINTALMFVMLVITAVVIDPEDTLTYIIMAVIPMIVLLPFTFRLSRSIYLHLFGGIDYKGK
ncbi:MULTISPECIES: DUF983 domain-containing protein [unclassified Flammeovirga]|uniref:DUF983 domain-containing protein n=1 Tax=unclassified Flammeovirga TaxID=2637820 RepID=UPI0005C6D6A0|nr:MULTISPECIES: DUF983 domain-containing protein [unclassified Flammeovirga]MBD0402220.1 DUF983 domain-containing protein [Flammeovirga sp. EKP202]